MGSRSSHVNAGLLACTTCLWLFAPVVTAAGAQPAAAALPVAVTDVDLGLVGLGTNPEVAFTVRNDSDVPLMLTARAAPPGLRVIDVPGEVPARSSSTVRVALDTYRAGMTDEWTLTLDTSDAERPAIGLTVRAAVRAFIDITPASARFTFVQFGREGGTRHVVASDNDPGFEVLRVTSTYPHVRPTVREAADAERVPHLSGRQWLVEIVINRDAEVGPVGGYVVLDTNHPRQPVAIIPVSGFVRPVLATTPPEVALEGLSAVSVAVRVASVTVKNFADEPVRLLDVSSDIPGLEARLVEVEAGRTWRVELHQQPALPLGTFEGAVHIDTDHADVGRLRVPVRGTVGR